LIKRAEKNNLIKKSQILIKNLNPTIKPPFSRKSIVKIINKVMNGEDCDLYYININLITNREIRKINKKFLNHDYYTDVITFPYENCSSEIEGEIFISLNEVKRNSLFYKESFLDEFKRVLIHGCLHLTGYNDKTNRQKELIREKENFYMSKMKRGNYS
jgi:rRNA maturation RNase YbeY